MPGCAPSRCRWPPAGPFLVGTGQRSSDRSRCAAIILQRRHHLVHSRPIGPACRHGSCLVFATTAAWPSAPTLASTYRTQRLPTDNSLNTPDARGCDRCLIGTSLFGRIEAAAVRTMRDERGEHRLREGAWVRPLPGGQDGRAPAWRLLLASGWERHRGAGQMALGSAHAGGPWS